MGRAATRQGRGGAARRARPRPSFEAFPPKKASSGDGMDPTVREFLPWHVVQRKLAARASGHDVNEMDDEDYDDGPDSGVQESAHLLAANDASGSGPQPLTYKAYTIAELDAQSGPDSVPAVMRSSMLPAVELPKPRWLETGQALLSAVLTFVRWATMGKGRPALADAMRAPGVVLAIELRGLGRDVNWRKLAFIVGVSATTIAVLLFAVITVADLTDDYHAPGAAAAAHATEQPAAAPVPATPVAVAQPIAPAQPQMELGDDPPPPPPSPSPRKKGKHAAAPPPPKAEVEVFIP